MEPPLLTFNGVDADSGKYLLQPMTVADLAAEIRRQPVALPGEPKGVMAGVDARRLKEAGWGVIFHRDVDPEVRKAVAKLLELRKSLSSSLYKELTYHPGETYGQFLTRHSTGPEPVDPEQLPYYLLIVGGPAEIPFSFQFGLDVGYAVGRIAFDSPEEYRLYAKSVVEAETTAKGARPHRASFFGPCNQDEPTRLTQEKMIDPLAKYLRKAAPGCDVRAVLGKEADKAALSRHLEGEEAAAFLFTAGHAACFSRSAEERQRERQGALVMSDWPGPENWQGPIPEEHYFGASDLKDGASLHGLISFHFACYSAGTPELDAFAMRHGRRRSQPIAPSSFVARLPQKLLGGGALAVVGHVERAWKTSFLWQETVSQLTVFKGLAYELFTGTPVGLAMESFGQRYGALAVHFNEALLEVQESGDDDALEKTLLWTAYHDAQGYVVLGDPAVRLQSSPPETGTGGEET